MFERILIVTGDGATRLHINALLRSMPGDVVAQVLPRAEPYCEFALAAHGQEAFELIIVDQNVRRNEMATATDSPDAAIDLIARLRSDAKPPSILFLWHELRQNDLEEIFKSNGCKALGFSSPDFAENFKCFIDQLADQNGDPGADEGIVGPDSSGSFIPVQHDGAITIEFDISDPGRQSCNVSYHEFPGKAPGNPFIDLGTDASRLRRFVEDCDEFEASFLRDMGDERWVRGLRRLGERAADIIFHNYEARQELAAAFDLCRQRPGSLKIRFNIAPDQHPGLYEAAIAPQNDEHLMVKAATVRRVSCGTTSPETLQWCEKNRLNILAIESLVGSRDVVEGDDEINLADLTGPVKECLMFDELRDAVERRKAWSAVGAPDCCEVKVAIGNVTVLRDDDSAGKPLRERIREELKDPDKRYDIVHYAGHSVCRDERHPFETSSLIVPTIEKGFAEKIDIRELSSWLSLSGVQFVYLSSCKSAVGGRGSRAAVAEVLAREAIPACLGFRWDIDDGAAVEFAQLFYRSLFCESLSLDEALMLARREVYFGERATTPIWASPVLFLQSTYWNSGQNTANRIPAISA